jgi:hypothetical protein
MHPHQKSAQTARRRKQEEYAKAHPKLSLYPTKALAMEYGAIRYAGKPCVKCENTVRRVKGDQCVACIMRYHLRRGQPESPSKMIAIDHLKAEKDTYLDDYYAE